MLLTGVVAMFLTNDVALFLIVPFTLLFGRAADVDLAPVVVLEISSANLIGALLPTGNPQNLYLFSRGSFTAASFLAAQAPIVLASVVLLGIGVRLLVPARPVAALDAPELSVDRLRAAAFVVLLAAEVASLLHLVPHGVALVLGVAGAALLGRRLLRTDFSLVLVFAFLFVGVAGLERGRIYAAIDPERIFGAHERGMLFSGALLSQVVSNVPAALLLSPAAASGVAGFRGLLRGVTAGGCGTPLASIANLIGAQLYLRAVSDRRGERRRFWTIFGAFSAALLVLLVGFAAAIS